MTLPLNGIKLGFFCVKICLAWFFSEMLAVPLLIKDGKLLVADYIGHHCFLPGGHVELGESVEQGLIREWEEELGTTCSIEKFLGVIENHWKTEDTLHYEIAHVFKVTSDSLEVDKTPASKESHLAFHWITPREDNLKRYKVMPDVAV
jgi:8-oxo-dGTP diphosphatase